MRIRSKWLLAAVSIFFLILPSTNANAVTINVDGDLTDLINAQSLPFNSASGSESGADAENNGFDITNFYSHWDFATDTFYFGFATIGPVGDSCSPNNPGFCSILQTSLNFDSLEQYGFQLALDATSVANFNANIVVSLTLTGDSGAGTGPDTPILTAPGGVTVNWAVSEAFNGVEFSVQGLSPLSGGNPRDFGVRFTGGSGHNAGPEDEAFLFAQVVPIPAAVWLFGSGLIALFGVSRRKAH